VPNTEKKYFSGSRSSRPFGGLEDRFQIHDRRHGHVAALAQPGLQQVVGERALGLVHVANQQPLARERLGRD
jgi:hypothetical protein